MVVSLVVLGDLNVSVPETQQKGLDGIFIPRYCLRTIEKVKVFLSSKNFVQKMF